MKTSLVIDKDVSFFEHPECFSGTLEECDDFIEKHKSFNLDVIPIKPEELKAYNK